ncbi:MAG: hypothetical protein HY960_10130 [Ignavibacteriae bacterium]|nr:hypothetical protein [Ignavibacteriota bacterium]
MTVEEKKQLRENIDAGIKAAIADALERHRRLGQPIVISRAGKIITLQPEEIGLNGKNLEKNH